jgi:hypothetical protein
MPPLSSCLFTFSPDVSMSEVEGTFELALMTTETLHGAERVALDAVYRIDAETRTIEIDRSTDVGGTLALVVLGFLRREYAPGAFRMRRLDGACVNSPAAATTTGGMQ